MRRLAVLGVLLTLTGCVAIGPSGPYRNGQVVDVSLGGSAPGSTVRLSECGPGQVASTATGCLRTLAGQPSVRLDARGAGSTRFRVTSTVGGARCDGYCSIAVTDGKRLQTKPISFVGPGSISFGSGVINGALDIYLNGRLAGTANGNATSLAYAFPAGTYQVAYRAKGAAATTKPLLVTNVKVLSGQATTTMAIASSTTKLVLRTTPVGAPPPANLIRVTFVNTLPVRVFAFLGNDVDGPVGDYLAPGRTETLSYPVPANQPDGVGRGFSYPPVGPGEDFCRSLFGPDLHKGHSYLLTIVTQQPPRAGDPCPYTLAEVLQAGLQERLPATQ